MGKVVVDTKYLLGYAKQLDGLAEEADQKFQGYISKHYANIDGMDGWLSNARGAVENIADTAKNLNYHTATGLIATSASLCGAANSYDSADKEAARQLFQTAATLMPEDYEERDVRARSSDTFPRGLEVDLPTPKPVRKAPPYRKRLHKDLDDVSPWIEQVTGYDVLQRALSLARPEWGSLDRIGEAYRHGSDWYYAIADNMRTGMNILSSHWTDGAASAAFDYFIRERWMKHLETRAVAERMMGEDFEYVCAGVDAVMEFLAGIIQTLADFARKMRWAMDDMSAEDYWEAAKDFVKAVWAFHKIVKTLGRSLGDLGHLIELFIDLVFDEAHTGVNMVSGYDRVPTLNDTE